MEIKREKIILCLLVTVAMGFFCTEGRDPVLHRVGGGRFTWAPGINFTEWSRHEHFYIGDWLYFGFDKNIDNVLEVNKDSYDNCTETNFITNITRGGRDVFQLLEAKPYYFISGKGFCIKGMRLAVYVEEPTAAVSPTNIASQSNMEIPAIIFPLLATALAWTF
ncbi:hypothetical protein L6164_031374 [Bauhinia variegata]|uniref:Uncharacterized protein n=1 Tax=Bauhinia variegata TaxID=167791 RepID=A0ACB9LET9_BAUVA|nr:hypothetical protein L6164_031374 [Bauhinia variegata]